jgi:hypothetical protein
MEYLMFNVGVGSDALAVTTSLLPSDEEATAYHSAIGAFVRAAMSCGKGDWSIGTLERWHKNRLRRVWCSEQICEGRVQ